MAVGGMDLKWVRRRVTEALLVSGAIVACLDEIFHVPQTQQYCRGDLLTWHPLITTLPGLYYLALVFVGMQYALLQLLGIAKIAARLASTSDATSDATLSGATSAAGVSFASLCSPVALRSLNLLLLVLSFPLFYSTARAAAAAAAGAASGASDAAGATAVAARSNKAGKPHSRPRGVAALLHRYETRYDTRDETRDGTGDETQDEAGNSTENDTKSRPRKHAPWDEVDEDCTWRAAMFVLFPLHWFFGFLYYTDVASSVAVLAMMRCVYKRQHHRAALLAAGSIIIRQTNAVWALLALCLSASQFLGMPTLLTPQETAQLEGFQARGLDMRAGSEAQRVAARKDTAEKDKAEKDKAGKDKAEKDKTDKDSRGRSAEHGDLQNGVATDRIKGSFQDPSWATGAAARGEDAPRALLLLLHRAWALRGKFLGSFFPLLAVLAAFFVFVRVNGGIVVGARTEHRLSPHLTQPLYFAAFSALSLSPLLLAPSSLLPLLSTTSCSLRSAPGRCLVLSLLVSALLFLTIKHFSLSHPYLLADNRHYPFYIWRRLINPPHSPSQRFLLLPVYALSLLALTHALRRAMTPLGLFFFSAATAAVLVPSPLLEFRYFIPPFLLLLLHLPLPRNRLEKRVACALVVTAFAAVDIATMALFLFRPFKWEGHEGLQRFLW
ncbi:unnamed protein product [Closterium sp. Naga37s-1]|nr:unnamed protein product [Closterium sp. Naga37s-1]